ncbi:hypothetical protein I4U23_015600 [Adineta vaga]|nr:hypothetical protein I4U23_015600 [Adineta vaga]
MRISRRHTWMKYVMICCIVLIMIIVVLGITIIYRYTQLLEVSPLSSAAFWEDNRTLSTGRSLPSSIRTINNVNLTNFTLVITACCRNVEKYLGRFQKNIRAIGNLFGNYKIYLGESDSQDRTLEFIQNWAIEDPNHVYVYSAGNQRWNLYLRTRRIAHCRNHLLSRARADMPSFDYYLTVDIDKASSPKFTIDSFLSNFMYPLSSWSVMTASQTDFYYDLWALRIWPSMPFDFIKYTRQASIISIAWQSNIDIFFSVHNKGIPRDHPLIEVESAFGGAAIYNAKYLSHDCSYDGWMNHGFWFYRQQCEHVTFNQCVKQNAGQGKFFINPMFETTSEKIFIIKYVIENLFFERKDTVKYTIALSDLPLP